MSSYPSQKRKFGAISGGYGADDDDGLSGDGGGASYRSNPPYGNSYNGYNSYGAEYNYEESQGPRKRNFSEETFQRASNSSSGNSLLDSKVAQHYNARPDTGLFRHESPIIRLKSFNNWVKSVLLNKYGLGIGNCKESPVVLDLCCGKGGDVKKWKNLGAKHVVFTDIAQFSVEQCLDRYKGIKPRFSADFIVADSHVHDVCLPLGDDIWFDIVSCQFALHYSFATEQRARQLLQNASKRLKPGGIFVGTTVDGNVLIKKLRNSQDGKFSNSCFSVDFKNTKPTTKLSPSKPFGIEYVFYLQDAIDSCAEYVVHFPTLQRIALEYDLELVLKQNFHQFFYDHSHYREQAESYELLFNIGVMGNEPGMSADEWEAAYLYVAFVFQKREPSSSKLQATEVPNFQPRPVRVNDLTKNDIAVLS